MYKKKLMVILVLGILFSLSGVFAGHFVEINGTINYRLTNMNVLSSGYSVSGDTTNGTIDLLNNMGGVLTNSLLYNIAPVVYLFPIENTTDFTRTIMFNVSDDSNITGCYLNVTERGVFENKSIINKSGNNSILAEGLTVGEYTSFVYCKDYWNNTGYSDSVNFLVTKEVEKETPSSGSTGGGYVANVKVSDSAFRNGFTRNMMAGDLLNFSARNQSHTVRLDSIGNGSAIVTVQSTPQVFTIKVGDSVSVDINNDSVYDVEVSYVKNYGKIAQIKIKEISVSYETKKPVIVNETNKTNDSENIAPFIPIKKPNSFWGKVIFVLIILVVLGMLFYLFRGIKKAVRKK